MSEDYYDTDLPDRADLRNEMSKMPMIFSVLLTLGVGAGSAYLQWFKDPPDKDTAYSLMLLTILLAIFTFIYYLILKFVVKSKKM